MVAAAATALVVVVEAVEKEAEVGTNEWAKEQRPEEGTKKCWFLVSCNGLFKPMNVEDDDDSDSHADNTDDDENEVRKRTDEK